MPRVDVMMEKGQCREKASLTICFALVAYRMQDCFAARATGICSAQAWSRDELLQQIPNADVLVTSGLWRNDLVELAPKLRFIQSIGSPAPAASTNVPFRSTQWR